MNTVDYAGEHLGKRDLPNNGDVYLEIAAYGGAQVADVVIQMVGTAVKLQLDVHCVINGVRTVARPSDVPSVLYGIWEAALTSGGSFAACR